MPISMNDSFIPDFFDRYRGRFVEEAITGCWLWRASATPAGYGTITWNRRSFYAHRASFEAVNGKGSGAGLVIRHRCDTPSCVNPDHLLSGSHSENAMDSVSRGRARRAIGHDAPTASLSEVEVRAIRAVAALGWPIARVKRRLRLPQKWETISKAATGKNWKHLAGAVSEVRAAARVAPFPKAALIGRLKLTSAAASTITRMRAEGATISAISAAAGVSRSSVYKVIRNGERYVA